MQRAEEVEPDALLFKPVSRSVLLDAIARALHKQRGDEPRHERRTPTAWESLRGLRVLVVEDNEINQRVAREILEDAGLRVELASSGADVAGLFDQ